MIEIKRSLFDAVGEAFNNNDIDAVMNFFAEDAVFDHAIGPSPYGKRFIGISEIQSVFSGLFKKVDSVYWETLDCRIAGNKAFCEYRRTARYKDGSEEEFLSVDILTFRGGLIVHKDTYYKQLT